MVKNIDLELLLNNAKTISIPKEQKEILSAIEYYSSVHNLNELIQLFDTLKKNDDVDISLLKMMLGLSANAFFEKETNDFGNYLKGAMDLFQIASGGYEVNYWRFYKERNKNPEKEDRSVFALRANKVGETFKRDLNDITSSEFLKSIKQKGPLIGLLPPEINYEQKDKPLEGVKGIYLPVNIHLKQKPTFLGVIEILNKDKFTEKDIELSDYFAKSKFSKEVSRYFTERRDELTGLYTRKATKDLILSEVKRSVMSERPVSVIISDIDHFKNVNDTRGHDGGDYILSRFSDLLYKHTRPTDRVSRYGGEEFLIILPQTGLFEAHNIADRIRQKIEEEVIMMDDEPILITSSFGVNQLDYNKILRYIKSGIDDNILYKVLNKDLINPADKHLYRAKQTGRNKVCSDIN